MSDVKAVGIIGQAYEDRTTGKVGVLESRDDKCKTLMLIDEDGKGFNVSYSSFRSKWRKYVEEQDVVAEDVKPAIEITHAVSDEVELVTDDNGDYRFIRQGLEVVHVKPYKDGTYSVSCFPDIYTDSIELRPYTSNFKCTRVKSGLDVSFKVAKLSNEEVVALLTEAVACTNLYGYIEE